MYTEFPIKVPSSALDTGIAPGPCAPVSELFLSQGVSGLQLSPREEPVAVSSCRGFASVVCVLCADVCVLSTRLNRPRTHSRCLASSTGISLHCSSPQPYQRVSSVKEKDTC